MDDNLLDEASSAYGGKEISELSRKPNQPRQGVIKFNPTDLSSVVNAILDGANKVQTPRCGASYLLFMSLRHTDATNDDALLKVNYQSHHD